MLQRIRELAVQADGGTLNSSQQDYIDMEVDALGAEIGNVVSNTKYNGIKVFTSGQQTLQAGWDDSDTINIGVAVGLSANLAVAIGFSATAGVADASNLSLSSIDTAMEKVNEARSTLGAQHNRLEHNASNLMNVSENLSAARSRILDTDFAAETAELARTNVLQQAGMAMLSQANVSSQNVLSLLGK
jgi:flagellin